MRLWAITAEGLEELARHAPTDDLPHLSQRDLQRAAVLAEATEGCDGRLLIGLHAGGVSLGVLDIAEAGTDTDLLNDAAPIVACAIGLMAAQGIGDVLPAPISVEGASDVASLMATFAAEAKQQSEWCKLLSYGPTNPGALKLLPAERVKMVGTNPDYASKALLIDNEFWAANLDKGLTMMKEWFLKA